MAAEVDLVINTWERSYREVLAPGVFAAIEAANRFELTRRVALVNNVADRADARERATALVRAGEIDEFHFVDERLDDALSATGLTRGDLGKVAHYLDCCLVAVTLVGSPWLLYWDAEVRLARPIDWITPSIELMERDERILVVNPAWVDPTLDAETYELRGDFAIGQGFSDQLFLVRRERLAEPIYRSRCLSQLRFPLAHLGAVFESRVDAHMRHHTLLRATFVPATYVHPPEQAGASYPAGSGMQRLRAMAAHGALAALRATPPRMRARCCRVL